MMHAIILVLLFLFTDGDELVKQIQDKYESIKYLQADFNQVTETQSSLSGKFYFSKENNYRIELPNNIIISNGKSIWNKDKKRSRVVISSVDDDPLAFSLDQYIYEYPEKCKTSMDKINNGYLLYLDASETKLNFKSAKLWITKEFLIEKILVVDYVGNLFTLKFNNLHLPNSLDKSLFEYVETDMKVIDLR